MRVAVPKETAPGERRVALVPEMIARLAPTGFDVAVERGAGDAASFPDEAYLEAGATVVASGDLYGGSGAVVRVQGPSDGEVALLPEGVVLIGFLQPLGDPAGIERLAARGVTAFAMESIPRISRAQSMDALSSQATVAGYKAVLIAAERLPKFFPMLMTAAGTVAPASRYASSGQDAAAPAPRSTATSKPVGTRRAIASGTRATRRSPGAVSLGTATLMPREL